jgi:hypothetical protein
VPILPIEDRPSGAFIRSGSVFFLAPAKNNATQQMWNTTGAAAVQINASALVKNAWRNTQEGEKTMKLLCGVMALVCVPATPAKNDAPYPKEKIAEFVVAKLDVSTLPPAMQPKRDKGKKTFGDYGYVTRRVDENAVLVEAASGGSQINIKVLELKSDGIYVCIAGQGKNAGSGEIQRVYLLKRKDADGLLKGRESWKDFASCPVIGGDSGGGSYGG